MRPPLLALKLFPGQWVLAGWQVHGADARVANTVEEANPLPRNYRNLALNPEELVAYSFRCRRTGLAKEAFWAARCAYEALDDYVITNENIEISAPGAELDVLNHPLVQAELARQSRDFDELREGTITVHELRDRAKAEASAFLPSP